MSPTTPQAGRAAPVADAAARVLVIDDEPVVVEVLRELLARTGYRVEVASDGFGGRGALEEGGWDALLLDVMLPDEDGLHLLRWVRERQPDLAVVMITAFGTVENAVQSMKSGAFHYVTKPFKNDEVRHLVAQAIQTTRLRRENRNLRRSLEARDRFERIVGRSRPMQEVYSFIDQVAPSRSTVLIQGESGTGKELVAHAIHSRSPRADKPFVVVNSSSIPADLLEDNLFGHERGAFTGADSAKIGLLEAADGGTVLFDEITTVAPAVQAKLLRVIQEKAFLPLGSIKTRTVDVRILAATNEDVRRLVDDGRFREDLFYRLNVLLITLPPLRQRLDDLPLLAGHFLRHYNRENAKRVDAISPEALDRMLAHRWPGNVRELENVIERGVVLAHGEEITVDLLPRELQTGGTTPAPVRLPDGLRFYDAVSRFERQLIEAALRRSGGIQKQAAEMLGLKPTTLNEKIKRLRIRG
ncbi:MAG TPA: sigma-54 dependent transcriptional regulator [Candidatus Polarisedimenticolaceae bacterium]|nr:sigma-54 dependent transcriptional regulator [Candidatus Polarisedimenticolaceae bacterium]